MGVADRYMNEAKSLEKTDPTKANADYIRAWRLYSFGRWPIPASPGKQRSYEKAIEAFLAHAKFWDPPLEIVRIPFEGKEIIGYLRLPKNASGPGAAGARRKWAGQPQGRLVGELQRNPALRGRLSRRGWSWHGAESDQGQREC